MTISYDDRPAPRELAGVIEARALLWARMYAAEFDARRREPHSEHRAHGWAAEAADNAVRYFDHRFGGGQ